MSIKRTRVDPRKFAGFRVVHHDEGYRKEDLWEVQGLRQDWVRIDDYSMEHQADDRLDELYAALMADGNP